MNRTGFSANADPQAEQLDESELPDIAHLTRDEKQKAKKDATDVLHNGMHLGCFKLEYRPVGTKKLLRDTAFRVFGAKLL